MCQTHLYVLAHIQACYAHSVSVFPFLSVLAKGVSYRRSARLEFMFIFQR